MDDGVRQLPRGRHGLAREEVVASQRGRLSVAVIEAVAEYGYAGTTVAHIVRGARVSRETFYEHFSSKDDCYFAAITESMNDLIGRSAAALDGDGEPMERIDAFLGAYLQWMADHPAEGHCFMLELRGAGPQTVQREQAAIRRLTEKIGEVFGAEDLFSSEVFVAALQRMVATRIDDGDAKDLPALREPLMQVVRRFVAGPLIPA